MQPGFCLNCCDRSKNPCYGAHDPSMMFDPVSGEYYSYSTDVFLEQGDKIGIPVRKSKDLVNFTYVGTVLSDEAIQEGRDNGAYPPTVSFWAPFVEYVNGEYRMYYSATKAFGSSESRIWLAVSEKPEGPFENRGVVMDTWFTTDELPNAIDAHIIDDEQGRKYLVYGSFFGGIYLKELEPSSGMPLSKDAKELGHRIAVRPQNYKIDGPEGAAIIYHKESGYYYLFLSYGWLGENYDIRVGRSKTVMGPYLDFCGKDLNGESYGLKLAGSYCFTADKPFMDREAVPFCGRNGVKQAEGWSFDGFRGPGHGVPFYDEKNDAYYFVHHVRDGATQLRMEEEDHGKKRGNYLAHYMMIRRMDFVDGWPVLSPEPYCGEVFNRQEDVEDATWEWITFEQDNNEVMYSFTGKYRDYPKDRMVVMECYDFENSRVGMCATGITKDGTVFWGKKGKMHEIFYRYRKV